MHRLNSKPPMRDRGYLESINRRMFIPVRVCMTLQVAYLMGGLECLPLLHLLGGSSL